MRIALSSVLFLGLHCGGPSLPTLGKVKVEELCANVKRCDARGDEARSTLEGGGATPVMLAEKQGPQSYLGKVAPERNARGVLKTCGGDVVRDDWLESGQNVRVLELSNDGKQSLREAIKTHVARELLAHPELLEGQEANFESVVDAAASGAAVKKLSMISQTYWLNDAAFERRVAQCGEEEYEQIIYSLTLLQLSEMSRKEIEAKIYNGLASKLVIAPAAATSAPAAAETDVAAAEGSAEPAPVDPAIARRIALQERAFSAVRSLGNELRFIAAFGYDEK